MFLAGFVVLSAPYMVVLRSELGTWTLDDYGNRFLWTVTVFPLYGPVDNVIEKPEDLSEEQALHVARYTPSVSGNFAEPNRLYGEMIVKYVKKNPGEYAAKFVGRFLNNFTLRIRTNTDPAI